MTTQPIRFIVLGAPRSMTTWISALMTTDKTLCLHDPLWNRDLADLDRLKSDKVLGIACTGLAFIAPDWVNAHPARKLVVHRPLLEIQRSLGNIGLPQPVDDYGPRLDQIHGHHIIYDEILNPAIARNIFEWLSHGLRFDAERHAELVKMNVQPAFRQISVDRTAARRLVKQYVKEARGSNDV